MNLKKEQLFGTRQNESRQTDLPARSSSIRSGRVPVRTCQSIALHRPPLDCMTIRRHSYLKSIRIHAAAPQRFRPGSKEGGYDGELIKSPPAHAFPRRHHLVFDMRAAMVRAAMGGASTDKQVKPRDGTNLRFLV